MEEGLVVVEAALGAGDQVHDARRVGGDDAGARRLLRPVLEIRADPGLGLEVEAEPLEGGEADGDASLLRVDRLERREPPDPRHVRRGRRLVALGPEQAVEPALALGRERRRALDARAVDRVENRAERHPLLVLVAGDGIDDARDVRFEPVAGDEQRAPFLVEGRRDREHRVPERVAARVLGLEREPGLGRPQRQLLPVPGDARGEQGVLERVLLLGELARHDALLARQAQSGDRLARLVRGRRLRLTQRLQLLAREEIRVARDDRRLLGGLLLPHAHRARLLGALDPVRLQPGLELSDRPCAHAATSTPRRSRSSVVSRPSSSSLS